MALGETTGQLFIRVVGKNTVYAHSSGLGFRVLCRSLVQAFPRIGCSSSISLPSTSVVGRNASNGWSRKNCLLNSSSRYAISSGLSAMAAGFFREVGRSNSEREGGARAGRGKGGCSSTAWNHAGSRLRYPALSKREACLCTWEATRLTIGVENGRLLRPVRVATPGVFHFFFI